MTEKKARNAVTGTRKKPPANAAETLLELAASGYNKKGLAYRLGTTVETLNKWLEIHPELQQALDEGREREHHALFNALYENATKWVYAPSTFDSNRFIDTDQYRDQLESACPDDPELLRAWMTGDWAVNRGAYFASVLDEGRNAVDPWKHIPDTWETWLAHDFGSSAPSATYIFAQSPGGEGPDGKFYPRGSLVLVDELVTAKRDNPNAGLGWTVPVLAEEIVEMCKRWDIRPYGVADDAIFAKGGHAAGSIADEFQRCRVSFRPAKKADRITGWNIMRRLLADAGKVDKPGLYISRGCTYLWETLPTLARDQKRVEDLDSTGPDHGADAVRYGCLRRDIVRALKMKLWI
jgi:hypothetical protein